MPKKVPMTPELAAGVQAFVRVLTAAKAAEFVRSGMSIEPAHLVIDEGLRYVRIWAATSEDEARGSRGQSFAFIDKAGDAKPGKDGKPIGLPGDVLKPATWRAPAEHARGNVLDASWVDRVGPHGPEYLVGGSYPFHGMTPENVLVIKDALLEGSVDKAIAVFEMAIRS